MSNSGTVELHELADNATLAKHLDASEHKIGGGNVLVELTRKSKTETWGRTIEMV